MLGVTSHLKLMILIDVEVKKTFPLGSTNCTSRQSSQPGPSISWPNKENFCPYQSRNKYQQGDTLATGVNTITVKKKKKT